MKKVILILAILANLAFAEWKIFQRIKKSARAEASILVLVMHKISFWYKYGL
ncbi:MAG: hypothetical protein KH703_01180 [Campylobacter gracilis]|uniref:hypothetical protein n=1 Tax=Campylobacter gracilis TaxID=824 RepID=UPI0026ECEDA0|nr:hypothetical protein [Campylobacter gracilis]MBS6152026.1 hypothetical protein [Campylobacter gracilis]